MIIKLDKINWKNKLIKIQNDVNEMLHHYFDELRNRLANKFYGLYIYNSVARGEFEPKASDIDCVVILNNNLIEKEHDLLFELHANTLKKYLYGDRLDGMYLQHNQIGSNNESTQSYPYISEGNYFKSGYYDINNITWWSLKTDGISINSPNIKHLLNNITWHDVKQILSFNLNRYWKEKINQQHLFLEDLWVEFGVTTISRIIYSLKTESIISKTKSCCFMLENFPEWKDILSEAIKLRMNKDNENIFRVMIKSCG